MTTPDDDAPPSKPGQAASAEALKVLQILHRHPHGLRQPVLLQLSGISADDLAACMRGLRERGRIVPDGHGQGTLWRTYHHALAAGRAARQASEAQA